MRFPGQLVLGAALLQLRGITSGLAKMLVLVGVGACAGCRDEAPPPMPKSGTSSSSKSAGETDAADATTIRFTHMTDLGIDYRYRNGSEAGANAILESLGGGVGVVDYDLDGLLDIFFPGGGGFEENLTGIFGWPSVLYRNLGDWKFADVSEQAGGKFASPRYTHGVAAADYDNDGFPDILVTGYGGVQLWHNQGDGTFVESAAAAGLDDDLWSSSAAWGDLNGDGNPDLYLCHYVNWSLDNNPNCLTKFQTPDICSPRRFQPLPDRVYFGQGDGTFRNGTTEAQLRKDGKGLGVVLGDVDLDGDLDIYVANDTTDNFLYLNDGHGVFTEVGGFAGVATDEKGTSNGSMGVDLGDFNKDGRPDIWVANFEVEAFALYRNEGEARFLYVSQSTGVTALNGLFVGFGTAFVDLDRDGDEDLVVANGHVIRETALAPFLQQQLVLINEGAKRFRRLTLPPVGVDSNDKPIPSYFEQPHGGRGLAVGDLDNDGDQDLVFANNADIRPPFDLEAPGILRNDSTDQNQSVQVRLIGRRSARDAAGAILILHTSAGEQLRLSKGGSSYLSTSDPRIIWGIPAGVNVERLEVHWPSGATTTVETPRCGEEVVLIEAE